MNILHINFSDTGGAANAALNIHNQLLIQGISSRFLILEKPKIESLQIYYHRKTYNNLFKRIYYLRIKAFFTNKKIKNKMKGLPLSPEIFALPYTPFDITLDEQYKWADVIHLHWISRFVDYGTFFKKNHKPIIWTIHDKGPFSGGLHCTTNFPFKEYSELLQETEKFKAKALSDQRIYIVSPSQEYKLESEESNILGKFPHYVISHGINHKIFSIKNKIECRKKHGLPLNKKLFLTIATDLNRSLKGFKYVHQLSNDLSDEDCIFCTIGASVPEMLNKANVVNFGYINDENKLSELYNAADFYISTSLEESFGQTVAESVSCGIPVIAYEVGGIKDIIKNNFNGFLIKKADYNSLKNKVKEMIHSDNPFSNSEISNDAQIRFNINTQTKKYLDLYKYIFSV